VIWNNVELLDMVEAYAEYLKITSYESDWFGLVSSEEELSTRFDEEHEEWLHKNRDDQVMIDEEFNNWTDALCSDGVIHPEQYNKYCYVGKYAE